jgi:hypothetical protein
MLVAMDLKNSAIALTAATFTTLITAEISSAIVTATNNPNNRLVATGTYSGVARLSFTNVFGNSTFCTGSLLEGGLHILTAAHCLTDDWGDRNVVSAKASFLELTDLFEVASDGFFIFPEWQGDFFNGNDLAVLKLNQPALGVEQYGIYRDTNEVGQVFTKVGYGRIGTGRLGDRTDLFGYGKLYGKNRFDARGEDFPDLLYDPIPGSQLLFDFDNGNPANNFFPNSDLGLGRREINTAPGDSGSPAFIGNLIAGVTTYGDTGPTDIDSVVNSSFGEYSSETRVSFYQGYIDQVLAGNATPSDIPAWVWEEAAWMGRQASDETAPASVPEPSSVLAMLTLGALGVRTLSRDKIKVKDKIKGVALK